jgi:cytochrome c553
MYKRKALVLLGLLLLLSASACAQAAISVDNGLEEPVAASSQASTSTNSQAAVENVAAVEPVQEEQVDYCTFCHTDKQMLIDTAKPEEEVINENKGEG